MPPNPVGYSSSCTARGILAFSRKPIIPERIKIKYTVKEVNRMEKNVLKAEKTVRIVLGIILALLAIFATSRSGWLRIVLSIIAVASLGTAFVNY